MTLRDRRSRHDAYYRRARNEGFAARAVYKLVEIDRRFRLLSPGDRVLDLGCWPGSWLQYLERRVGPKGRVVGIDEQRVTLSHGPTVRVEQGDLLTVDPRLLLGDLSAFDAVVSDAAPHTTGIRETDQARSATLTRAALDLALAVLRPGGHFVGKVFDGPEVEELRARMQGLFASAREVRPEGSRKGSTERYLVGLGRH